MTEKEVFSHKAPNYLLCFINECPRRATCLRWLVGQELQSNDYNILSVNPMHPEVKANKCALYREKKHVRYAKGMMHFYDERYKAGNMYALGSGLCPWYASWMASVLANYGDRDKSLSLLHEAAAQIGYFSEHFEINEKDVVRVPWFTTAAGNYVHALDQTMLLNRGDDVFVCHATPTEWKDYSFTLPCYGNMLLSVEVRKGKLRKCEIAMNRWSDSCSAKTFWIPDHLLELKQVSKAVLSQVEGVKLAKLQSLLYLATYQNARTAFKKLSFC